MSRIYFHSEHDTAELSGSERAYMGYVCQNLLESALGLHDLFPDEHTEHWVARLLPETHYAHRSRGHMQTASLRTAIHMSANDLSLPDGTRLEPFALALNTALRIGGDALKLMARLHGQCELHCWVDGSNRAWLADIIERGRAINLYRPNQGWEGVIALLRWRDDGPVVCSYSVCEQFPNQTMASEAGWECPLNEYGDADEDAWYDMPDDERWRLAMDGLKAIDAGARYSRELRPDTWAAYHVGNGMSGYDLAALAPELTGRA